MLSHLMSSEETHEYLTGIYIAKHPKGGVVLVATDGHRMGVIHDADGRTDDSWICHIPKDIAAACGTRVSKGKPAAGLCHFIDGAAYVTDTGWDGKTATDIGPNHLTITAAKPIDGTYPNWIKVVPKEAKVRLTAISVNPKYMADWARVSSSGGWKDAAMKILATRKMDPFFILFDRLPEFIGIQMPARGDDARDHLPEWMEPLRKAA